MKSQRFFAVRDDDCLNCGFCREFVACSENRSGCIGCGACLKGCPQRAIHLEPRTKPASKIRFHIDGEVFALAGRLSVFDALKELGFRRHTAESDCSLHASCGTGGCWNCEALINGELAPACITPIREGMEITLDPEIIRNTEPKRVVTLMRPPPHFHPSIFTQGCNYNCDLCHNWHLTFSSTNRALTPAETFERLNIDPEADFWVGISGGEPTLNRRWLVQMVRELRQAAPEIRIQVDTNASTLTPDYIDELVDAGMTDISPDLKALRLETFMKVSGVPSETLAGRYLEASWDSVRYIAKFHGERVFMAVSIPCHPRTHTMNELEDIARTLAAINPEIPVTVIEYQPAFRLRDWPIVGPQGMDQVQKVFESAGLGRVIVQSGSEMPKAVNPLDLALSSEEF